MPYDPSKDPMQSPSTDKWINNAYASASEWTTVRPTFPGPRAVSDSSRWRPLEITRDIDEDAIAEDDYFYEEHNRFRSEHLGKKCLNLTTVGQECGVCRDAYDDPWHGWKWSMLQQAYTDRERERRQ